MGTHDFKYNKLPLFAQKRGNINTSMSAATILAFVPASRYYCDVVVVLGFYVPPTAKVIRRRDLGLKSHPKDWRSPGSNSGSLVYKAGSLTARPRRLLILMRCNLVIPQCMCQVSLRLKEVQMGTHDFKYNKVTLFLLENQRISILRCLLPRN